MRTVGADQKRALASLLLRVDRKTTAPLHSQIDQALRARILAGAVRPGTRLPSSRTLAAELGVARTTVLLALDALQAEGYLVAAPRSGVRVAPELPEAGFAPAPVRAARASSAPPRLSLAARALAGLGTGAPRLGAAPRPFRPGLPALDLFPMALWSRLVSRAQSRASARLLEGGDPAGHPGLRRAISEHVVAARGARCTPEQVFVTAGTQQAFEEVLRLVVDPGDPVWLEDPGYLGARRAVLGGGARAVPVPVDDEGLDVEEGVRRAPRARLVILAPSHQYPLGVTLSLGRRMALLRWAAAERAMILEDDYDSEFRHRGRPLTALQGLDDAGRVLYVGTFSKTMFPGLRLGYVVVPPALVDVFAAARASLPAPASALEQAALATFMDEGHFARHLRRMRGVYRERAEALLDALRSRCAGALEPRPCDTGMQLCAMLARGVSDVAVRDRAARAGVEVAPLSDYRLTRGGRGGLVFGFGAIRPAAIRTGVESLERVLEGT
ncbi:MAG TPA: PLP-dependent aminotransferase family protein [Myxococcaceae bacterium]|nr:PLP-dependent aminotransferase family protein [Myxococcaceae bacterium]